MKKGTDKKVNIPEPIEAEFEFDPKVMRRVPDEKRHGIKSSDKVKITMWVDYEILKFFKQQAEIPNNAPYQTQMNNALRDFVNNHSEMATINVTVSEKELEEKIETTVEKILNRRFEELKQIAS